MTSSESAAFNAGIAAVIALAQASAAAMSARLVYPFAAEALSALAEAAEELALPVPLPCRVTAAGGPFLAHGDRI